MLEKNPDADLVVYAVWFDVLAGDDKSAWIPGLFDDPRVVELWDGDRSLGEWFPKQEEYERLIFGPLAWDIYFLYGPEAQWTAVPSPVASSGSTIIGKRSRLEESILPLLSLN